MQIINANKSFFERVYEIVAAIPEGYVATYGQISRMLGYNNGARQVGYAMSAAPNELNLPHHRVVSKTLGLTPDSFQGYKASQRKMLIEEGITFLPNGLIDLSSHQWCGDFCEKGIDELE